MPLPTVNFELSNFLGLNTWEHEINLDPRYVVSCENVEFDEAGVISKRRGVTRIVALSGPIRMIYDFQKQSGFSAAGDVQRTVIVAGSTLHVLKNFNDPGGAAIVYEGTFSATAALHYAVASNNGACYISNENGGIPKVLAYISGAFQYTGANLTAPSAVPPVAIGVTGSLTGNYAARYTYEDTFGNESNPSPASATVALTADVLDVGVTASADPTVILINLYVLTPAGSQYKFSRTASNVTATISHTVSDLTVEAADALEVVHDPMPAGKYVGMYNDMLLVAGDTTLPDLVYVSNFQFHRQFSLALDNARVTTGDGQPIRGFGKMYDQFVVGKADSLHSGEGTDNTTFVTRPHNHEYGVLGQPSMSFAYQKLVFFSDDGIYVDDSVAPTEVSLPIRTSLRKLNPDNLNTVPPKQYSANYKYYKKIYFAVREAASAGDNDTILVWNYERNTWTRFDGIPIVSMGVVQNRDDYEFLYGGDASGNVFLFNPPNGASPNRDNIAGSPVSIDGIVDTPWINIAKQLGIPGWERIRHVPRYIKLYAGGEPAGGNSTITMTTNYFVDFSTTISGTFSTTHSAATWPTIKIDPKTIYYGGSIGTFNWIKFRFSNSLLDEHFKIHKVILGVKLKPAID